MYSTSEFMKTGKKLLHLSIADNSISDAGNAFNIATEADDTLDLNRLIYARNLVRHLPDNEFQKVMERNKRITELINQQSQLSDQSQTNMLLDEYKRTYANSIEALKLMGESDLDKNRGKRLIELLRKQLSEKE